MLQLPLDVIAQPDDTTCGITCLRSVYRYHGLDVPFAELRRSVRHLDNGGTLECFLGIDALQRGFSARILSCNFRIFDPTWFCGDRDLLITKLAQRIRAKKKSRKLCVAMEGHREFLLAGGTIELLELSPRLLHDLLAADTPLIAGLSETFLYRSTREVGREGRDDDVRGEPAGHFVVIHGISRDLETVAIADPYGDESPFGTRQYCVSSWRLINAILLGVLSFDGNLLIVEPDANAPTTECTVP